ncbi:MAG: ferredoxin [Bacteroidetes bacterium]|nr:ferredoxin [Bacteroidota bacterium]
MPKIIHYRNKCIGCGVCYEQQPSLWRMSRKDGKAILLRSISKKGIFQLTVPGEVMEQSAAVAKACPVNIIKIV